LPMNGDGDRRTSVVVSWKLVSGVWAPSRAAVRASRQLTPTAARLLRPTKVVRDGNHEPARKDRPGKEDRVASRTQEARVAFLQALVLERVQ